MFPWFWMHWSPQFAPQMHFPLSGAVTQDFVQSGAGDKSVEREVGDIASYGRQLGWLSEVLLGQQADATAAQRAAASDALQELRTLSDEVAAIKQRHRAARLRAAAKTLKALAEEEPEALAALLRALPRPASATKRRQ